jgi:hypothetical protein
MGVNELMGDKKDQKIIIEGVTDTGETFRPTNWAERMSGKLSTFQNHRIRYSPMLQPVMKDGNNCVLLDEKLKESNPALYESILNFATENKLRICKPETEPEKK